jgi:hypothetical protein
MVKKVDKVKVDDEWSKISGAFVDAQFAATEAFAAFEAFQFKAPSKGGQKAYAKWRDANNDEFFALEYATMTAARDYVISNLAQERYFEREEASK